MSTVEAVPKSTLNDLAYSGSARAAMLTPAARMKAGM